MYAADVARASADADTGAARLNIYDQRVWKRLGKELAISTRLQSLADKPWLFDFVVDRANRTQRWPTRSLYMFTDLDLRERLKKPGFSTWTCCSEGRRPRFELAHPLGRYEPIQREGRLHPLRRCVELRGPRVLDLVDINILKPRSAKSASSSSFR